MPVLETERLILKPHEPANAEKLNAWSNDPELLYFDDDLPEPYRVSPMERTIAFIEKNANHYSDGEVIHWAIHLKVDGGRLERVAGRGSHVAGPDRSSIANRKSSMAPAFIGYCMAAFIDRYHRKCKFGITIGDKSQWGQGYAREAISAVLRFLFEELNLNRVQCEIYDFNARSIRLFESLGFKREGVCRQSVLKKGRYADEYVYGMLREDWAQNEGEPDKGR